MRHSNRLLVCMLCVVVAFFWGTATAAPLYHVLDLGINLFDTATTDLNNHGQVVGHNYASTLIPQAFRTQPNSPIDWPADKLGGVPGLFAQGINSLGQVAGADYAIAPARWEPGASIPTSLVPPGSDPGDFYGFGEAINDSGQVAGWLGPSGSPIAFRTAPNASIDPATDYIGPGRAMGLNSLGQAVGGILNDGEYHAFRTGPNAAYDPASDGLGTLGGAESMATAINSAGQVVGWAQTDSEFVQDYRARGHPHAFLSTSTEANTTLISDLGTLGGSSSWATDINDRGEVVGYSALTGDATDGGYLNQHGFLYLNGTMYDLNDLVDDSGLAFEIISADAINEHGQIAATALLRSQMLPPVWIPQQGISGQAHAILLSPIPEPSTVMLALLGFVGLAISRSLVRFKSS